MSSLATPASLAPPPAGSSSAQQTITRHRASQRSQRRHRRPRTITTGPPRQLRSNTFKGGDPLAASRTRVMYVFKDQNRGLQHMHQHARLEQRITHLVAAHILYAPI